MARRLDEALANAGVGSRREVRGLLLTGHVAVDGKTVNSISATVEGSETVTVDGVAVSLERYVYLVMHKPCGTVCENGCEDSVLALVPDAWRRKDLFCVGRLDKDTSGLLLLTNDGAFAHRVTSPSRAVPKTYRARLQFPADDATVAAFAAGMTLRDGTQTKGAELRLSDGGKEAEVTLCEGKYHEVRRLFAACGNHVQTLCRVAEGPLTLDLPEGATRPLTEAEKKAFL